jgi:uncharacterized protein (UPF0332 family)
MTESEKIRALAGGWMTRADQSVRAARTLVDADLPAESVNRSYYGMFYAVSALLLTRGLGTSKHKGALSMFSREFVRTGAVPREMAEDLNAAFRARLDADYDVTRTIERATAEQHLTAAERFVTGVRPILAKLLDDLDASSGDRPGS